MWGFGGSSAERDISPESREISELNDLFGGARSSSIPVGLYVKFEVSQENIEKAKQSRRERSDRDRIREEKLAQMHQTTMERRAKILGKSSQAKNDMKETKLEMGRQLRAMKQQWDDMRQADRNKLAIEVAMKADHHIPTIRLDALEEATAEQVLREA